GDVGTMDQVRDEISDGYSLTDADHAAILAVVAPAPGGSDFVDRLSRIDPHRPDAEALLEAFLTQERRARKTLLRKAVAGLIPDVAERLTLEATRLEHLCGTLVAAEL